MTANKMDLNTFLGHKTRDGGNYLKKWTKRQPPQIDVVLHTKSPVTPLWQHGKPRVQEVKREGGDRVREAWGGTVNCIEPESTLRAQYRRIEETGAREVPPRTCPMCILVETVRQAVRSGKIGFTQPVFRWCGDDPEKAITVTAAGMWNGYGDKKLAREQALEVRKAGIKVGDAWRESMMAKCNYVFVIADLDDPQVGALITTETTSVGDKMKGAIRDRMTQLGEDDGNPFLYPVAFRWQHFPNEQDFGDKYKCFPMPKISLEEVESVIRSEPPSIEHVIRRPNLARLRAELEAACLVELPWDGIFGKAEELYAAAQGQEMADAAGIEFPDDGEAKSPAGMTIQEPERAIVGDEDRSVGAPAGETSVPAEELLDCDACGKPMKPTEFTCPNERCGRSYDPATGQLMPEEAKPRRRRRAKPDGDAAAKPSVKAPNVKSIDDVFADADDDLPAWAK